MSKWNFYTTNEIKPRGWLKRQLEIQAEGLSGNLDKFWRDIKDSAWIGGSAEGWERVPYWLDGFIPLACLLEDEDMMARAKRYIDSIIANQQPDGWICPCGEGERANYDTWAILLITKVLTVYYDCTRDERIPGAIYRALKNYYELLRDKKISLFGWGEHRWFEGFIAINFVYGLCGEEWLVELARMLKEQGTDYAGLTELWKRPLNVWKQDTHIVNICMSLKYEAVSCGILGGEYQDHAEALYRVLREYNGTPTETFTGDECLSGLSPIQGTELCSVTELMYSYELLYAHTGEGKWAERLETVAFNALPAALSDDMWAHQYDQMSNQMACRRFEGKPIFRTNNEEAHLFGLEPGYGCCTANFNQGWPKFALSEFMHSGGDIINVLPVPSELTDGDVHILLETGYPFENSMEYTIESQRDFKFIIRVPSFAEALTVNGEAAGGGELSFEIRAGERRKICVSFGVTPHFEKRPYELNTVKCGSLVFSVPVKYGKKMYEYERDGVERRFPYCDYEYIPESPWNYAYSGTKLTLEKRQVSDIPFSSENPPVVVKAYASRIDWGFEDGYDTVCAKIPQSRVPAGPREEISLYPYGCAKLRMTELPLISG